MSRLERRKYTDLTEEQRAVFDDVVANRPVRPVDGHMGGPFDIWLRSPEMGKRLVGLGGFFRFRTTVERRYIEVVILTTGASWQAQFEWWAHEPMAREAGVPDAVIDAIRAQTSPAFDDDGDRLAWQLARELQDTRTLSKATFDAAKARFGETGVAELIGLAGFYTLVSMTLNAFDVELPPGSKYPFPRT